MIVLLLLTIGLNGSSSATQIQPANAIELDRLSDPAALERRLRASLPNVTVANGQVRSSGLRLAPGDRLGGNVLVFGGDADLAGEVAGNIVVLDRDLILRPGGVVTGNALVIGGRTLDQGGSVRGELRAVPASTLESTAETGGGGPLVRLAGLAGVMVALFLAGFGLVTFARPRLEVISDTVARSFFRSLLIGLLAEIVAIPTAALVIVGLVISIVGILLLPFIALVVPLLLLTALLVGFLSALHAMGELRVRRRMAAGELAGSPNSYRFLLLGLFGLGLLWLAWIVFGWVPVAGTLVFLVALTVTWIAATAGLGAFLLSRAGLRGEAAGRFLPPEAMTDEYLWATPRYGVTAAKRPKP